MKLCDAAAGCMFLLWNTPTDRALAGWSPFPWFEENGGKLTWLRNTVSMPGECTHCGGRGCTGSCVP